MMGVQAEKDLVFAAHDQSDLTLDIYRPRTTTRQSPSTSMGADGVAATRPTTARRLAQLSACGVTVVAVNYRLVPRARFPSQLHDLKAAVRWLRGNGPRLGLPTERIGILGASAGAYLGSLLA
jgi:acetyl esterase/lipase